MICVGCVCFFHRWLPFQRLRPELNNEWAFRNAVIWYPQPECTCFIFRAGRLTPPILSRPIHASSMFREALVALALSWAAAWFLSRWFDPRVLLWPAGTAEPVLSASELGHYTGAEDSPGLYLAVLGQVFDVQRGHKHYGPGGAYSFFSGTLCYVCFGTPFRPRLCF